MVYRAWLGTVLLIAGCAPRMILPDEGAGGTSEDTDTVGSSDGGESDSSPVTTQPPTATIGPMSTSGPATATFGTEGSFDSSGFFGSSGDAPAALCWSAAPMFVVPEESRLFVRDQDGDGLEELWLSFFEGDGPGASSDLFWFDTGGEPNVGGFFPGFMTGLHNLNGDDALDAVGFAFGGGGPPSVGYIQGSPQFIDGPVTSTTYGFEDGSEGFIDVTNDGLDDFLRNLGDQIEFLEGNGAGEFFPIATVPTGLVGELAPQPVRGNKELFAISQSSFFDELSTCSFHPFELHSYNGDTFGNALPSGESMGFTPTELIGAEHYGAFTNVYARACAGDEVTVQVQRFEGSQVTQVEDFDPSSFATLGDFDGNGFDDIGLGSPTRDTIRIYNGSAAGTFTEGVFDEVLFGQPVPNRVFVVDMDADGRDEIILGTRDGGSEIAYQRLDLQPC